LEPGVGKEVLEIQTFGWIIDEHLAYELLEVVVDFKGEEEWLLVRLDDFCAAVFIFGEKRVAAK